MFPKGEELRFLERCLMWTLLVTVTPIAKVVSLHVEQGDTIREIAQKTGLNVDLTLAGLCELRDHFNLVSLRPDRSVVTLAECDLNALAAA